MTTQVPTRLACFAVISAIEEDLRDLVRVIGEGSAMLTADSREKALRRNKVSGVAVPEVSDAVLMDYADFADLAASLRLLSTTATTPPELEPAAEIVEQVSPARNRVCHARPLEPEDFVTILEAADRLIRTLGVVSMSRTSSARERLSTDPTFVFGYSIPDYWHDDEAKPAHNLPLPEFDDTGFLGRARDRKEVLRHLLSAHPVVTIVGEGGIGKTALALRCLYDLVELEENQPYDYVVWISLKTSMLTSAGIQEIKNSITTALGIFQKAAGVMGVPEASKRTEGELLHEIAEYLQTFKVLLAIDNLETVDAAALRPLLIELAPGSKVLLTSRVGLGEFELRYPLDRLTKGEAKGLMRRYAQTLNLQSLLKYPDALLDRFVQALFGNPLLIKWFVSGIMAGSAPEQIVFGPGRSFEQALAFCFENLYERLDATARRVLHIVAAARRPLTRGQLLVVTELPAEVTDATLIMLHNSSMLRRQIVGEASAFSLTDIAEKYLTKLAPPPVEVLLDVSRKLREMRILAETNQVKKTAYKYEWSVIECAKRDPDELIAASVLRSAVAAQKRGAYVEAEDLINRAKEVKPAFSETYRILAGLETLRNRPYAAEEAHRHAVDLDPSSAKARYARAMFQLENNLDYHEALADLEVALSADPGDATLEAAKARTLVRLGRYTEAQSLYHKLLANLQDRPRRWRIITRDQAAESLRRMMEHARQMDDASSFVEHMVTAFKMLRDGREHGDWDEKTLQRLQRICNEAASFAVARRSEVVADTLLHHLAAFDDDILQRLDYREARIGELAQSWPEKWNVALKERTGVRVLVHSADGAQSSGSETGVVAKLLDSFGFVDHSDGRRLFFHRSDFQPPEKWSTLYVGARVTFRMGSNQKGPSAKSVRLVSTQTDH